MHVKDLVCAEIGVPGCFDQVLLVRFTQRPDRVSHSLFRQVGDELALLLESVEDEDLRDWPSSPPIQEYHFQQIEKERKVVFGVGMAGQSHWSMTVEPAGDPTSMVFDIACRIQQSPQRLGSRYRVRQGQPCGDSGDIEILLEAGRLRIELTEGPVNLEICSGECRMSPLLPLGWEPPHTVRWRYRCRLIE